MIDLAAAIEQYLEPAEPGVLVELDRDDAAALAAEVRAARTVVAAARGCPALMGPGVFDADLVDAACGQPARQGCLPGSGQRVPRWQVQPPPGRTACTGTTG